MSDYDAAFKAASENKPSDNPYDAVMSGLMAQVKPTVVAEDAPVVVKAGAKANDTVSSIPRQLGLTARYALEGPAQFAQIITEPLRYFTDRATGSTGKTKPLGALASQFADSLGLPQPEGSTERVVGDAAKLVAGAGAGGALSQLAARGAPAATSYVAENTSKIIPQKITDAIAASKQLPSALGSNMTQQLSSAAGAGLAGGSSKEAGGSPLQQGALAVVGGVLGGMTPGATGAIIDAGKRALTPSLSPVELDKQINVILQRADVDYSKLPAKIQQSLRNDLRGALQAGKEVDPAAVARLADFKAVGATPTRGMVSLDPVQITREQNLAKIAANSGDDTLHGLPRLQNENNRTLIRNLNDAGANKGDPFAAGESIIGSIAGKDAALKSKVTGLYDSARAMPGGETPLDRSSVVNGVFDALAKQNKMAYLPEDISNTLNSISLGKVTKGGKDFDVPFDAKALDNLLTDIATAQRGTQDGNVKAALSIARKAIDSTGLKPVKTQFGGNQVVTEAGAKYLTNKDAEAGEFMGALNQARSEAAKRFGWQESSKPVEAALDGFQPDKFVQRFVLGGTLDDAKAVAANAPAEQVKTAIVAHLKDKALGGAADEVGKFSQSAYNKAMNQIGYRKLGLFFSPEEISQLKAVGRAASYMQHQPTGSAVNNSNSGALLAGKAYDALNWAAKKVPFGESAIAQPLKNIEITMRNKQAQNVAPALLRAAEEDVLPTGSSLLLPAIAAGGALAAP